MNNFNEKKLQDYLIKSAKAANKELELAAYGGIYIGFINLDNIEFRFEEMETYSKHNESEIVINKNLLDNVKNLDNLDGELINIIKLELIRHHTNGILRSDSDIYRFTNNFKPIFLSYLQFFNIKLGLEDYLYSSKYSDLSKWVKQCSNFAEFHDKMIEISREYEAVFRALNNIELLLTV